MCCFIYCLAFIHFICLLCFRYVFYSWWWARNVLNKSVLYNNTCSLIYIEDRKCPENLTNSLPFFLVLMHLTNDGRMFLWNIINCHLDENNLVVFICQGPRLTKRVEMPTIMLLYYYMCLRGYLILQLNITAGLFPQEAKTSASCTEMAFLAYQAPGEG